MTDSIIAVETLGKMYRINHQQAQPYVALRDVLATKLSSALRQFRRNGHPQPAASEDFWALRNVSFDVAQGEVIGIIGRNGAGKSTLLKILSRITEPTEGRVTLGGRVASLLEVGTGFHPELTGRENIILNGSILGMARAEISRKFDEIVAFAEVEEFLDTPVKRYSSGMYVRLAFAVAAHLEPEILVVDEVLAVGDADFQQKCLGKMSEVARGGRTVLFVSHNMAAVMALCSRAILLSHGTLEVTGNVTDVLLQYSRHIATVAENRLAARSDRAGNGALRLLSSELLDSELRPILKAHSGQDVIIALEYSSSHKQGMRNVHFALGVHGRFDERLFHLATNTSGQDLSEIPRSGTVFCRIKRLPLQPGGYTFNVYCTVNGEIADWVANAGTLEVDSGNYFGSGRLPPVDQGLFLVDHSWTVLA